MGVFKQLQGDTVILTTGGVYKQVNLYERDGDLYAGWAGGFIRLYDTGATSQPVVRIEQLITNAPLHRDPFGRLSTEARKNTLPVAAPQQQKLIGAPNGN